LLLDYGAHINMRDNFGCTPLMISLRRLDLGIARLFLDYGADALLTDNQGKGPLHVLASTDITMLREDEKTEWRSLFQRGGMTPLHCACYEGNVEAVRILISEGADVNSITSIGNSPLLYAVQSWHQESYEICKILIQNGAD
ncbi:ankyrin, partial [Hypoxylon sp. EC38]